MLLSLYIPQHFNEDVIELTIIILYVDCCIDRVVHEASLRVSHLEFDCEYLSVFPPIVIGDADIKALFRGSLSDASSHRKVRGTIIVCIYRTVYNIFLRGINTV